MDRQGDGMKTIKEWKARLQIGTMIKQIWNLREGDVCHIYMVTQIQSNGIFVSQLGSIQRSWMFFPKRGEITFTDLGWIRMDGAIPLAEYLWMEDEEIRPPEEGMQTPDGKVQFTRDIAPGVYRVDTGSHGFLVLPFRRASHMLSPQACAIGEKRGIWLFFEEDCAIAAPLYEHPEWLTRSAISPTILLILGNWNC